MTYLEVENEPQVRLADGTYNLSILGRDRIAIEDTERAGRAQILKVTPMLEGITGALSRGDSIRDARIDRIAVYNNGENYFTPCHWDKPTEYLRISVNWVEGRWDQHHEINENFRLNGIIAMSKTFENFAFTSEFLEEFRRRARFVRKDAPLKYELKK